MTESFSSDKISTAWIEQLALEELSMHESGVIQFNQHLDPATHLDESSVNFMDHIRDRFEIYVTRFNQHRSSKDHSSSIKIFKISNTVNDFMLFRNALKLIIARKSRDTISIGFLSNAGGLFAARLSYDSPSMNMSHELKAHVGPFNNISWRFSGEPVDVDALVRHYLTEFVKHSAR